MSRRFRSLSVRVVAVGGPALGLIMAFCPAAGASSAHPARSVPAEQANGWYGYADTGSGGHTYSEVSGSWVQPAAKCTATTSLAAFWVGLDGYSSDTAEQVGTLLECNGGTASYFSWWELYPENDIQIVGDTVKPGDKITASLTRTGTSYKFKLTDATTPANSFTHTSSCAAATCKRSSAEWIVAAPSGSGGVYPIAPFGTWTVTGATVTSGSAKGVISSFPYVVINPPQTSPLNKRGNGFNVDLNRKSGRR